MKRFAIAVIAALSATSSVAFAGATVWVPNGATSAEPDGPGEPVDPNSKNRYPPWNAIDGDVKTTFVVVKGEALRVRLGGTPKIHHVELVPGYAKSAKVWRQNRRPTKVRVRTKLKGKARPWKTVSYDPPETLGDTPWWSIDLEPALSADTIELEVLESEAGKGNRSKDVCISEITLLTRDNQTDFSEVYTFDEPLSDDRLAMPFERFHLKGNRCTKLEHEGTGGGLSVFVGSCRIKGAAMMLNGRLELRTPEGTDSEKLKKRYSFRRVNSRVLLVGGYVFTE